MIFYIYASIHTYTHKVETTVLTFLETKQRTPRLYAEETERGCRGDRWLLFQFSDTNTGLIYSPGKQAFMDQ